MITNYVKKYYVTQFKPHFLNTCHVISLINFIQISWMYFEHKVVSLTNIIKATVQILDIPALSVFTKPCLFI